MSHANARLTVHGRMLLARRVIDDGRPVAHVAKELGVSRQCAHRWVNRYRREGVWRVCWMLEPPASLSDPHPGGRGGPRRRRAGEGTPRAG